MVELKKFLYHSIYLNCTRNKIAEKEGEAIRKWSNPFERRKKKEKHLKVENLVINVYNFKENNFTCIKI